MSTNSNQPRTYKHPHLERKRETTLTQQLS